MTSISSGVHLATLRALHPSVIDLTLDRMWRLLGALGNPQDRLPPVIHIAGTNGKGSTLAMLRAGLEGTGARVHAYTSPHLVQFHERIRLAGALIDEPALSALLSDVIDANQGQPITFFEATTCAALLAFARMPADFTLLEVGLGGRLDATNVIHRPAACVITPISLDHQDYLGDTVAQIAGEKAGILKRGVPAIIGPQSEAALEVIEAQAARLGAPVSAYGQHWHVTTEAGRLVFQDETGLLDLPMPCLPGPHQVQNAGTALATLRSLGIGDPEAAVTRAEWPARMQRLTHGPLATRMQGALWLDGGHNPAAGTAIAESLRQMGRTRLHVICGMLSTKDVAGFLQPLAPFAAHLHAISIPDEPATLSAHATATAARACGMSASEAASVEAALEAILAQDLQADVLICGSLYLAGHVLRENG